MKIIQDLVDEIKDELHGAKEYAELAVHYKAENPSLAKAYSDMAADELKHADLIHTEAVKLIEKQRATAPPPAYMAEWWARDHKKYVEKAAKVRYMLQMYAAR